MKNVNMLLVNSFIPDFERNKKYDISFFKSFISKYLNVYMIALILLVLFNSTLYSQTISKQKMDRDIGSNSISKLFDSETKKPFYLYSIDVPLTFSRMEYSDGTWHVGASMTFGGSALVVYGTGTKQENGDVKFDPKFCFGIAGNIGFVQDNKNEVAPSLTIGAVVGFSSFTLFGGLDLKGGKPVIGLATKISGIDIWESVFSVHEL